MGYAWASRDRLCPMRMVSDHCYSDHRFELLRLEASMRSLRRTPGSCRTSAEDRTVNPGSWNNPAPLDLSGSGSGTT